MQTDHSQKKLQVGKKERFNITVNLKKQVKPIIVFNIIPKY